MPHFGLMNPNELGPAGAALQRSRLHIRAGRRRIRQGKAAAGIATLYDAFIHAMQWYLMIHRDQDPRYEGIDVECAADGDLFSVLVRTGVITSGFDFQAFSSLTHTAMEKGPPKKDYRPLISGLEDVLTELEVLPFDEAALPPEDPRTY